VKGSQQEGCLERCGCRSPAAKEKGTVYRQSKFTRDISRSVREGILTETQRHGEAWDKKKRNRSRLKDCLHSPARLQAWISAREWRE